MNSPVFMNSIHEKVISTLQDTFARNERGVQAENSQYIKGWQDAFATAEAELNHLFTVEAEKEIGEIGPSQERKAILDKAAECVCGQREQEYGTPENNFARIARLWGAYTGYPFTAHDVAMLMALLKVGRIAKGSGGMDSYVDLCGYAACAGEIISKGRDAE